MDMYASHRPSRLGIIVCAASILLSRAAAQTPDNSSEGADQKASPVEVYTAPQPKNIDHPEYPRGQFEHEGWVELAFMVDSSGKPYEITVMRSTGNKTFDKTAIRAIERSTFEPGKLNGKPVESGFEMKYIFNEPGRAPGANPGFVRNYKRVLASVNAGDRAAADEALKKLEITNLYEDAFFGIATYTYAAKWGDKSQQLEGLRRAIAREDYAHYLPNNMFLQALRLCMQLELDLHEYAEAMWTWRSLRRAGVDKDTAAKASVAIEQLKKLKIDDSAYEVAGSISDRNWYLHLFKQHFRAIVSEGYISEARIRCDKKYVFFPFDSNLSYQVSSRTDGECSIELTGAPGTKFRFVQF